MITKEAALELGLSFYDSDTPCKNGHTSQKHVSNGLCKDCKREYDRSRVQRLKEHLKIQAAAWRERNTDLIRARHKEMYADRRDIILRKHRKLIEDKPWVQLYRSAKARSTKRGLPFDLTIDYVHSLFPEDMVCPITKEKMIVAHDSPAPNSFSLDRLIPENGYVRGNVYVISHKANTLKQNCTDPDIFRNIANWIQNLRHTLTIEQKKPNE